MLCLCSTAAIFLDHLHLSENAKLYHTGFENQDQEQTQNNSELPNVLFVIFDDLRPAMGVYGDPEVITPNFDQFASLGTVFKNAFVQVIPK